MSRPSNTLERRDQIARALTRVMAARGYEGATISAIADEAGLASGIIHYHFTGKNEILLAAVELLSAGLDQRYETQLAKAGTDPARRLRAFIDAHLALGPDADESAVAAWVVIGSEAVRQPEVREAYASSVKRRHQVLVSLLKDYLGPCRSVSGIAAAVLAAIEGCYQLSAAAPGVMPRGFSSKAVLAMVEGFGK